MFALVSLHISPSNHGSVAEVPEFCTLYKELQIDQSV